jgi:hypothetical protein
MPPRWIRTLPPRFQYSCSPLTCYHWLPTHSSHRVRMQGVPSFRCLLPHRTLCTSNPTPAGQGVVIRLGSWRRATCLHSQCWTQIFRQWRGEAWLRATLGYRRSGQTRGVQHAAAASAGSRQLSRIKCVVDSMLNFLPCTYIYTYGSHIGNS